MFLFFHTHQDKAMLFWSGDYIPNFLSEYPHCTFRRSPPYEDHTYSVVDFLEVCTLHFLRIERDCYPSLERLSALATEVFNRSRPYQVGS